VLYADLDPAVHFDMFPDPGFQYDADLAPHQMYALLQLLTLNGSFL
jgi:hypothetical protein